LKASFFHYRHTLIWLLLMVLGAAVTGCSEDQTTNDITEGPLSIRMIILDPKSAEPEDTVEATVVLEGQSVPGSFPTVEWSATAGKFVISNESSVKWVAPSASGIVTLTCKATNSVGSVTGSANIYVGAQTELVAAQAGEIHLRATPGEFYHLGGPPSDTGWDSSEVYIHSGGVSSALVTGAQLGAQFAFSSDLTMAAHAALGVTEAANSEDPIDIFLIDLGAATQSRVTTDGSLPGGTRHHQYEYPYFAPDGSSITFQGFLPNPVGGETDSLDVFVYYMSTKEIVNATVADTLSEQRRNLYPTFSTDHNWLVFVSDRAAANRWDLYGLPVTGGVVNTELQAVTRLTRGNLIGVGPSDNLARPLMAWNPNPSHSVLALVGASGLVHLISTTQSGANTLDVTDVSGTVIGLEWSPDGQLLAVSTLTALVSGGPIVNAIYTVTLGGSPTLRHTTIEEGDQILDMAWSPDRQFMVYRTLRGAQCWFELIDIDGGTGLQAPLVLTASNPVGTRSSYAARMATNARYETGNIVYMLWFNGTSPSITTLDVSNIVNP
jgi:Tol biopolymer transport system component